MGDRLLGRASELQTIYRALTGGGRAIAVAGPPGSGVSAVLGAARRQARELDRPVIDARPAELPRQLARLMTATEPMVLCVDDADRFGAEVLETIDVLGDRLAGRPVVLLAGVHRYRPRRPGWTRLLLPPLEPVDAGLLLAGTGVPLAAPIRERILAEAAGHPLALRELPLAWPRADRPGADVLAPFLPQTERLRETLAGPFTTATPDVRAVLLAAALTGTDDLARLRAVAGAGAGPDLSDVDGLVTVTGDRLVFASELVRGAVVQLATAAEIQAVHEATVRVLAADPHRRVWHAAALTAGPDEEVAGRLEESAAEAERRLAPRDALRRLTTAARLSAAPGRRLVLAGRKAYELGRPDLAEELLTEAEATGLAPEQHGALAAVRYRYAARLTRAGEPVEARCALAAQLIDAGRPEAALDVLVGVAQSLFWGTGWPAANGLVLDCLLRIPGQVGDPRYLAALAVATPRDARHLLVVAADGPEPDPEAARLLAVAAVRTGDLVRAADLLSGAIRKLTTAGRLGMLTHTQALYAHVTTTLGDWDTAAGACQEAMRLAARTDQPVWHLRARAIRATVRALRGDVAGALADCAEVDRVGARGHSLGAVLAQSRIARGITLLGAADWAPAYELLSGPFDDPQTALRCIDLLAEAAVHSGRQEEFETTVRELLPAAEPSPLLDLNLGYARALLAGDEDALAAALAATPPQWPWLRTRIQLALGSWLRRHRRVAESRAHLSDAHRSLELAGAAAWAGRAARELRAAGVPSAAAPAGPDVLSPQELHIARLAAEGLSNREIGHRMVLSPRTVASHLYRIFPKLDVTSRGQLAAKLAT